jgi:mannose-1-phosphate guanylyltransferase
VFLAEKPRFANNNLGWMKVGGRLDQDGIKCFEFLGWKYKPSTVECEKMFLEGDYFWNPGYFITSMEFLSDLYRDLAPHIYEKVVSGDYLNVSEEHFDRAIIEKLDVSKAVIIKTDMGWSDPGTLYALKEALEKNTEKNVLSGNVAVLDCKDGLFYNLENEKLMACIGLGGVIVVNTKDALLVVAKEEVVNITNLIKSMENEGNIAYL